MAGEFCNIDDKRELDYLRSLKQRGVFGGKKLNELSQYDQTTASFKLKKISDSKFLEKLNVPDDVRDFMKSALANGEYYVQQRRGVLNWKATEEMALEMAPKIKVTPGSTLNPEETESLAMAVGGLAMKAQKAASIANENPTEENLAIAQAAQMEYNIATASLFGARAEAGRTLNIYRKTKEALDNRNARVIREILKNTKDWSKVDQEKAITLLSQLEPTDLTGQFRFLNGLRRPEIGDYVMELWYNSILSGWVTGLRNLVGNASNTLFNFSSHPFAVAYDIVESKLKGRPRSIYMSELPADVQAAWRAIPAASKKAWYMMQNGFTLDQAAKVEIRKPEAFKGDFTQYINIPRRSLAAADAFFRGMEIDFDMTGRAFAIAKSEGLKGVTFRNRVAELIANPTKEMLAGAQKFGARQVFQSGESKALRTIGKIRTALEWKGFQPGAFLVPFVETPGEIYKEAGKAGPLGFASASKEPRERAQDEGRAMLGSLALMLFAWYASTGHITGSGPSDSKQRDYLYRIGWQPDSIKMNGRWYSYRNWLPLNLALSFVGNMFDGYIYDGVVPDTQSIGSFLFREGKSILNNSFFSSVSNFVQAIAGDQQKQESFVQRFATSLIPQIVQQTTRALDPTIYQISDMSEAFKHALGIKDGLTPKFDVFGRPIEGQRLGGLPLPPSTENISPLEQKLGSLGVQFLSMPPNMIGKRKMTDEEYGKFSQEVGQRLEAALSDDAQLPPDMNPIDAQDKVDAIRAQIYKDVRTEMFPGSKGLDAVLRYEDNSLQNPNNLLDNVKVYALAIGEDPVTAFNRMFTGQRIIRVDHNTVIVQRMDLADSEKIKKELGGQTSEMKLDHIIPLELGGSNSRGNLQLIPTELWSYYTPAENYLGKMLKDGKMEKRDVQKYITQLKQGKITVDDVLKIR